MTSSTDSGSCPTCGEPRVIGVQSCPSCGSAYAGTDLATSLPSPVAVVGRRRIGTPAIVAVVLIVVGLAIAGHVLTNHASIGVVDPANVPPSGVIWFGQRVDTSTFVLTGRRARQSASSPVAMVASLSRPSSGEYLKVEIVGSASTVPLGGAQIAAGSTLMAYQIPAVTVAGPYQVTITDAAGNILASAYLELV